VRRRTRRWLVAVTVTGLLVWVTEWQLTQALGPAIPTGSPQFLRWYAAQGATVAELEGSYGLFLRNLASHQDATADTSLASVGGDLGDLDSAHCPDAAVQSALVALDLQVARLQLTLNKTHPDLATQAAVIAYADGHLPALNLVNSTTQSAVGETVAGLDLTTSL
jgi:hypothetical protein